MIAQPESLVRFSDELEDLLMQFEEAWNREVPRDLRSFCPLEPDSKFILELVRIDISRRRRIGKTLGASDYLAQFPELSHDERVRKTLEAIVETLPPALDRKDSERRSELAASATPDTITVSSTYSDIHEHARGGLGEVFVADDARMHRRVALKLLQQRWLDSGRAQQFFRQEVEITSRLQHPGIVPVHAVGQTADGRPCYSMKFVEGETLREAIRRFHESPSDDLAKRSLDFRELLARFIAVCNTIAYAHSRDVLHRDLKPENIMLGPFGETLVLDWGLAKQMGTQSSEEADRATDSPEEDGTQAGEVLGTPAYMSPEQAKGDLERVGPASDIFGLGATLYAILTGVAPYQDASKVIMLAKARVGDFVPPRQYSPTVPAPLDAICRKAMAVESDRRYSSALDLARDVENWLADERVQAWQEPWHLRSRRYLRKRRTLVSVLGVLALLLPIAFGVGSWLVANEQAKRKVDRETAEIKERSAAEMSEYLVKTFETADPLGLDSEGFHGTGDRSEIAGSRRMLDSGAELMRDHMRNQPVRRASLLDAIGNSYRSLGEWDKAEGFLKEGFELRLENLGLGASETLASKHSLARLAQDRGEYAKAKQFYLEVIRGREQLDPPQPLLVAQTKFMLAWMIFNQPLNLQLVQDNQQNLKESAQLFQDVVNVRKKHLPTNHREIGLALAGLATVRAILNNKDMFAKLIAAEALEIFRRSEKDQLLGTMVGDYMKAEQFRYATPRRFEEAEVIYLRILELGRKHLGGKHPLVLIHMANIAGMYRQWDRARLLPFARSFFETVREVPSLRNMPIFVDACIQYGDVLTETSMTEAIAIYTVALQFARERSKENESLIQVLEKKLSDAKASGAKK